MLNLLGSWLRSKTVTVVLSVLAIVLSIYYGLAFELQGRVDAELKALAARGDRVRLADFSAPAVTPESNAEPFYMAAATKAGPSADAARGCRRRRIPR